MRAFDMDIVLLHTGAPWPLCVLWMAISRLLCGAQVHSILSQYQSEYPAILDIATYLGSWPLLVTSGEAWDTPYISIGEARTVNRERPPRVHPSTAPADH
jgi:hypothetical protein